MIVILFHSIDYFLHLLQDLLPTNHSAILVSDFKNVKDLVSHLEYLNTHDDEYEKYLTFKKKGGVTNPLFQKIMSERERAINNDWSRPNYISSFECLLCERLHDNQRRVATSRTPLEYHADVSHYGCPRPRVFSDSPAGNLSLVDDKWMGSEWTWASYQAKAVKKLLQEGGPVTEELIAKTATIIQQQEGGGRGIW